MLRAMDPPWHVMNPPADPHPADPAWSISTKRTRKLPPGRPKTRPDSRVPQEVHCSWDGMVYWMLMMMICHKIGDYWILLDVVQLCFLCAWTKIDLQQRERKQLILPQEHWNIRWLQDEHPEGLEVPAFFAEKKGSRDVDSWTNAMPILDPKNLAVMDSQPLKGRLYTCLYNSLQFYIHQRFIYIYTMIEHIYCNYV